jgi:hypothetical protein
MKFSVSGGGIGRFWPLGMMNVFGRIRSSPPKGGTPYLRGRLVPLAPLVVKDFRRQASGVGEAADLAGLSPCNPCLGGQTFPVFSGERSVGPRLW